ncbi:DUF2848 domain-containing protein [Streptomyces sp. GTA36]
MAVLTFELPDGSTREVDVVQVLNAGYAGRSQDDVAAHVAELAELGVPGPSVTPALYPVSPYLAQQTERVAVQHGRTSGEAEWALVVAQGGELLLTAACDHTDRDLEVHGVAWSKNASPDVLARRAWRLADVESRIDEITLRAWVSHDGAETEIQTGTLAELLTPGYWVDVLRSRGELTPGTVLISGTIPMALRRRPVRRRLARRTVRPGWRRHHRPRLRRPAHAAAHRLTRRPREGGPVTPARPPHACCLSGLPMDAAPTALASTALASAELRRLRLDQIGRYVVVGDLGVVGERRHADRVVRGDRAPVPRDLRVHDRAALGVRGHRERQRLVAVPGGLLRLDLLELLGLVLGRGREPGRRSPRSRRRARTWSPSHRRPRTRTARRG